MGYYKRLMIEAMQPKEEPPMEVLGWVPVKARLPEEGVDVLVMTKYGMHVASLGEDGLWNASHGDSWEFPNPTYWMPLPEPPG